MKSSDGRATIYVGDRCSMITCAADSASAGERHRRCAAADHHDSLARVVKILGPLLRMHDATAITLHPRPSRHVTLGVIVVAAAHVQEIGGELDRLAPCYPCFHRPSSLRRGPRRASHAMAIPNRSINPVVASCFANVVQYGGAVGDRVGLAPWPKLVSERVHIGIGAYSRIAKQVPGPAHGVSALQNGKALRRALRL